MCGFPASRKRPGPGDLVHAECFYSLSVYSLSVCVRARLWIHLGVLSAIALAGVMPTLASSTRGGLKCPSPRQGGPFRPPQLQSGASGVRRSAKRAGCLGAFGTVCFSTGAMPFGERASSRGKGGGVGGAPAGRFREMNAARAARRGTTYRRTEGVTHSDTHGAWWSRTQHKAPRPGFSNDSYWSFALFRRLLIRLHFGVWQGMVG